MMMFDSVDDVVGKVISDHPYVRVLTRPRYEEYELVPGMVVGRWEALAEVNGMLAVVELKVTGAQA
jgi:hypothetical protein